MILKCSWFSRVLSMLNWSKWSQKRRADKTIQWPAERSVGEGGDKRETKGCYNRLAVLLVLQEIYFRRSRSNSRLTFGEQTEGQTCHTGTLACSTSKQIHLYFHLLFDFILSSSIYEKRLGFVIWFLKIIVVFPISTHVIHHVKTETTLI